MDKIDNTKLKRNPELFKTYFKTVGDIITTKENLRLVFPEFYIKSNLAMPGSPYKVTSIYALLDDYGNYCVVIAPVYQHVSPYNVTEVMIDKVLNKVLHFEAGSTFIVNKKLIMVDSFMYDIFNKFYIQGKIPWFMSYEDVSNIFLETKKYANNDIGKHNLTLELLTSVISRSPEDKTKLFREIIKDNNDKKKLTPKYIGLENPYYTYDTTLSKIGGSYYSDGVISAIINKETKSSGPSDVLRS